MERNKQSELQSESMATLANLKLTDEQIDNYIYTRNSKDEIFVGMSDQVILYYFLTPEQRIIFSKYFSSINFIK